MSEVDIDEYLGEWFDSIIVKMDWKRRYKKHD